MDMIILQDALEKAYEKAKEYLEVFGAVKTGVDVAISDNGLRFYVAYWKESMDRPGKEYIFLSATGASLQQALKNCCEQAGIEYKSLVK